MENGQMARLFPLATTGELFRLETQFIYRDMTHVCLSVNAN